MINIRQMYNKVDSMITEIQEDECSDCNNTNPCDGKCKYFKVCDTMGYLLDKMRDFIDESTQN